MPNFAPKRPTKFLPLPTPAPLPEPMPPPDPPPKPFDDPPPVMPLSNDGDDVVGISGSASVALLDFEVMRAEVFAKFLAFFGCSLCSKIFARSPAAPPPAPVAKVSGSVLALSVQLETTQAPKRMSRTTWMTIDTTSPSPPIFFQKGCRRAKSSSCSAAE